MTGIRSNAGGMKPPGKPLWGAHHEFMSEMSRTLSNLTNVPTPPGLGTDAQATYRWMVEVAWKLRDMMDEAKANGVHITPRQEIFAVALEQVALQSLTGQTGIALMDAVMKLDERAGALDWIDGQTPPPARRSKWA